MDNWKIWYSQDNFANDWCDPFATDCEIKRRSSAGIFGIRHVQALLLFLGMTIGYSLRVAMSVAIVPMANATTANPDIEVNYVIPLLRAWLKQLGAQTPCKTLETTFSFNWASDKRIEHVHYITTRWTHYCCSGKIYACNIVIPFALTKYDANCDLAFDIRHDLRLLRAEIVPFVSDLY